jgi:hypothetical protein
MIINFDIFLINEIADTIVEPNIIRQQLSINNSLFWIKIKDRIFFVHIQLHGDKEGAVLQIDFAIQEKDEFYSSVKTNAGDPLLVMSNVVAVIKKWLSLDMKQSFSGEIVNFSDINLIGLWINSKSEAEGDKRRADMYRYFLTKNFEKLGIKILEEKDVTKSWNDRYGINNDNKATQPNAEKYVFIQYKIEPIKIKEIRNNL